MKVKIGIDEGGTFTDLVTVSEDGKIKSQKTPTTAGVTRGVLDGLGLLSKEYRVSTEELLKDAIAFAYGTTLLVNTCIQRRGARVGLITTRGFRDTLYIRRMIRKTTYDSQEPFPEPFVRRRYIKEVAERINAAGDVVTPLDLSEAVKVIEELITVAKVEAIAICLLHSYMNSAHENQLAQLIRKKYPGMYVTVSSEVIAEMREYERTSTTVFNAYSGPLALKHFRGLDEKLREVGLGTMPVVMHSGGGVMSFEEVVLRPALTYRSGPAGGVAAAKWIGSLMNIPNIITGDMGGTSFDVGIVRNGEATTTELTETDSWPLMGRQIEINCFGMGGGSIARVDELGIIKVGPMSAGARPGPVCYDLEGVDPTVTDADVILGYVDPDYFLGGKIKLNKEKALKIIKENIADKVGMDPMQAADSIYEIANASMVDAMRKLSVERGIDVRDFSFLSFGGASPVHAAAIHRELRTKQLLIPSLAPVFSAWGLLTVDLLHSYSRTLRSLLVDLDLKRVNQIFKEMETRARQALSAEDVGEGDQEIRASIDMSYVGQIHEITVPTVSYVITPDVLKKAEEDFAIKYNELYGFSEKGAPIQVVAFRLDGIGKRPKPDIRRSKAGGRNANSAIKGERDAYFFEEKRQVRTPIYDGLKTKPENEMKGPAIIEFPATSVVIRPGQHSRCDEWMNIVIV